MGYELCSFLIKSKHCNICNALRAGYKHFMRWVGCMPASRQNLALLLEKGSVAVTMGGIAEMCDSAFLTRASCPGLLTVIFPWLTSV